MESFQFGSCRDEEFVGEKKITNYLPRFISHFLLLCEFFEQQCIAPKPGSSVGKGPLSKITYSIVNYIRDEIRSSIIFLPTKSRVVNVSDSESVLFNALPLDQEK